MRKITGGLFEIVTLGSILGLLGFIYAIFVHTYFFSSTRTALISIDSIGEATVELIFFGAILTMGFIILRRKLLEELK